MVWQIQLQQTHTQKKKKGKQKKKKKNTQKHQSKYMKYEYKKISLFINEFLCSLTCEGLGDFRGVVEGMVEREEVASMKGPMHKVEQRL